MSESIYLFHRDLYHLDRTIEPHSLGAPFLDGGIYVGTFRKDYPKERLRVGIEEPHVWIEREDGSDLQIIVAPQACYARGYLDEQAPAELLIAPMKRLVLGRSAMSGYMTIPKDVMRSDGLEDMRDFADVLATRVLMSQMRLRSTT